MSITVAPGTVARIRRESDSIIIQVQEASDPQAAAEALARAADDIWTLTHPKFVSPVTRAGTGPFIMIDAVCTPRRLLDRIPDMVVARLEEVGVADATVGCSRGPRPVGRMLADPGLPRAVTLLCYEPPVNWADRLSFRMPEAWLAEAAIWVQADLGGDDNVFARVVTVEFPVRVGDAGAFLRQQADTGGSLDLVSGRLGQRVRMAAIDTMLVPYVALSGGGRATTDEELVDMAEALIGVARRLAGEVGYAVVSIDPIFTSRYPRSDWFGGHGGEHPGIVAKYCDEYVFDAFAYQVLGPGHLARLGGPPPGFESLDSGRIGLAIGRPADWLLDPPENKYQPMVNLCGRRKDPSVSTRGRQLVAPCLLRDGEGLALPARAISS